MIKRIKTGIGAVVGVAALAFGGSAIAGAAQGVQVTKPLSQAPAVVETSGPDTDNVKSGDQTTPDTSGAEQSADAEQSGAESQNSDGPGGYHDVNPNADTQQEGEH